jgi:hypothetical protein
MNMDKFIMVSAQVETMAATMCSDSLELLPLSTDEEKAANHWMALTESACTAARSLDILLGTMPILEDPAGPVPTDTEANARSWYREKNNYLVQKEVQTIRSNRLRSCSNLSWNKATRDLDYRR